VLTKVGESVVPIEAPPSSTSPEGSGSTSEIGSADKKADRALVTSERVKQVLLARKATGDGPITQSALAKEAGGNLSDTTRIIKELADEPDSGVMASQEGKAIVY
jgi:hypothetical protein